VAASLAAVLLVMAPAVSIPGLLILRNALLKSYCIYMGGENRERTDISRDDPVLGEGLFVKAFCKYSFSGDALNTIKEASRLM
jgi:hypothetical protein